MSFICYLFEKVSLFWYFFGINNNTNRISIDMDYLHAIPHIIF